VNAYRYSISLRLTHPSIDPAAISKALKLKPSRSWRAGDVRTTPTGSPLKGMWRETYWTSGNLLRGKWPRGKDLRDAIDELVRQFRARKNFFHKVRDEGGRIEFFIGWFFLGNSGDVLDCDLLARLAELRIDLSFDIYPPDQPQKSI
jgi:hypothetical protein